MRLKVVLAAAGLWLIGLMFATSVRADLVFALSGAGIDRIVRASNVTGNPADVVLTDLWVNPTGAGFSPWGVAVNEATQTVYWTDTINTSWGVRQVSVFGGASQLNFSHNAITRAISYHGDRVYFTSGAASGGIVRSNLDGSGQSTIAAFNPANSWTTIDRNGEYLYFSESSATDRIARVNLNGTPNVETVVGLSNAAPRGLALNGDYVYWLDNGDDFLRRSLIGSDSVENLLDLTTTTNGASATPNALTTDGQFLYWTESLSNFRGIYRSNLDGSNALRLIALDNSAAPLGIAAFTAVPEPSSLVVMLGAVAVLSLKRRRREVRR